MLVGISSSFILQHKSTRCSILSPKKNRLISKLRGTKNDPRKKISLKFSVEFEVNHLEWTSPTPPYTAFDRGGAESSGRAKDAETAEKTQRFRKKVTKHSLLDQNLVMELWRIFVAFGAMIRIFVGGAANHRANGPRPNLQECSNFLGERFPYTCLQQNLLEMSDMRSLYFTLVIVKMYTIL